MAHSKVNYQEAAVEASTALALPLTGNLRALQGLKVSVEVRAGNVRSTLGEVMSLQDSQLLRLDRGVHDPFDVVIDGQVIARGHLVAVGDHFGIRISEVVGQP